MPLLDDKALERSSVVANCCMNRERDLIGSNGYAKELEFHPIDFLKGKVKSKGIARWLDLCCGSGKALVQAAEIAVADGIDSQVKIVGVDLVEGWPVMEKPLSCLQFIQSSLTTWQPEGQFDLITCVHGLHYIGDKLGLLARIATWLTSNGWLAANLDLNNIKIRGVDAPGRMMTKALRKNGLRYNSRRKLITCEGNRPIHLPFNYLGADDQAGPNYTKQAVVDSYYERCDYQ